MYDASALESVSSIGLVEHFLAVNVGAQLGAEQEYSGELPMQ